jgi:heptose I phosphotransferase
MALQITIEAIQRERTSIASCSDVLSPHSSTSSARGMLWIAERYRERLEAAGLSGFDQVITSDAGCCLRVLSDRENWFLPGNDCQTDATDGALGMYLKKHHTRTWATRVTAVLGLPPGASPGCIEARNAMALQSLGIAVMPLMAYGQRLSGDGRWESFLLSEELRGYCELQDFVEQRFAPSQQGGSCVADPALRRLIVQVARIARRFHAAGFNHRDFYCCHFLVNEISRGRFDVRLIDLQRVQRRRRWRRRWIVKDLAQLASMSPDAQIGCREKVLFLRNYLGVRKLRPQDKRLVRDILAKSAGIRRRARHIA